MHEFGLTCAQGAIAHADGGQRSQAAPTSPPPSLGNPPLPCNPATQSAHTRATTPISRSATLGGVCTQVRMRSNDALAAAQACDATLVHDAWIRCQIQPVPDAVHVQAWLPKSRLSQTAPATMIC